MSTANPFNPRLVFGMIAAGIVAFAALLLLIAFGGNIGRTPGRDGRAHALSMSAVGFKGLVDLVGHFRETYTVETAQDFSVEDLVVVALEPVSRPADVERLLDQRHGKATLLILPKWETRADPERRGWVRARGLGAARGIGSLLGADVSVSSRSNMAGRAVGQDILAGLKTPIPDTPQIVSGAQLTPLLSLPGGGALVARLGDQPHYILADPDLLNNHGLKSREVARSALQLIDALNSTDAEGVAFDLTVNGLGGGASAERPSLLRVAFEPPFLVMTLALVMAALLAGLHGAVRFGQPRREERAIALGKAALVENSAGLIRLARREARLGAAYADVVRHEAARTASAPSWLGGEALDAYLDRLSRGDRPDFSTLAARLARAGDRHELVAAARALFSWKKDIIR